MSRDEEDAFGGRGLGFAGLSEFMSSDKEHSGFVFRRFKHLAARDLLYMQSELCELERELERLDKEDLSSSDRRRRAAKNWQDLCEEAIPEESVHINNAGVVSSLESRGAKTVRTPPASTEPSTGPGVSQPQGVSIQGSKTDASIHTSPDLLGRIGSNEAIQRRDLVLKIRQKLKEYQEAVLRNAEILQLQRVPEDVHDALLAFFWAINKEAGVPMLTGVCGDLFGKDPHKFPRQINNDRKKRERDDLMSLASRSFEDPLSKWLRQRPELQGLWRRRWQQSKQVVSLSEHRINFAVVTINVLVVAGLLFGAIFNLYFVDDEKKRLGILTGYTVAFSASIAMLTEARRAEIFGAAAAYAAVLVVFVSGGLGQQ